MCHAHYNSGTFVPGVIMVLGASLEFFKRFNSEIVERPSDNVEIPEVRDVVTRVGFGRYSDLVHQ